MKMNADAYAEYLGKRRSRLIEIDGVTRPVGDWLSILLLRERPEAIDARRQVAESYRKWREGSGG